MNYKPGTEYKNYSTLTIIYEDQYFDLFCNKLQSLEANMYEVHKYKSTKCHPSKDKNRTFKLLDECAYQYNEEIEVDKIHSDIISIDNDFFILVINKLLNLTVTEDELRKYGLA